MEKPQETHNVSSESPDSNSHKSDDAKPKSAYAKVYNSLGFNRGYNFPLWVIFAGGMLGFSLSRLPDLNYDKHFKENFALVPGYWYYFSSGSYRIGMIIHLGTILPAGILMVLQFTPVLRHKFILFHRINGYLVFLLCLLSNVSAFVVIRHNQGGGQRVAAQAAEYGLGIATTVGIFLAWWNVRRKQIDQHRAWMLRTMFYMGTIVTSRLINLAATPIITRIGDYYAVWSCDEVSFLYDNLGLPFPEARYPQCFLADGTLDRFLRVAVKAQAVATAPEELGASAILPFGTMLWICWALHAAGVEIYLTMTPRETERLRRVSYEKQVEAGFANPGSAGLNLDRWGDADRWTPSASK